jgi:hypothetical protein
MSLRKSAKGEPSTPHDNAESQPMIISHVDMDAACARGLVTPLGHTIAFAVHYSGTWWIHYEGGWIRTDPELAATLDNEATRITAQDAIIARNAAIRTAAKSSQDH